ncbi:sigma-70 family RNA polymerase sigma factor [Hyalangium rubrum]|uniref:Sigma-70 family RNA polymerase sigma factor n=1 Tax=Hyalangium rubrum TaxID=3103134 RepID=A0ABU5HFC3_9BACT|nr:sigma-70 family RNA polymerase sigma factor [Hyalangium sp. s54d21]MDY7231508.1 sigma-70 family RNA polymerase sigma factor [Hyalangium sp. s54d21]
MAPSDPPATRASDPADDRALLQQVALGDSEAMRALYARCSGRAWAVVLRILASRADAEEVLQETFLEVWRRAREFDPGRGGLETWVMTIARTRAIDRRRSLGTVARVVEDVASQPPPVSATPPDPSEVASREQERTRVATALRALPTEQRVVVELAYFEGLSQREISERTGDPLGTVKTRARLALEKLAALLQE